MGIEDRGKHVGGRTKMAASPVQDESPDPDEVTAKEHESIDDEETRQSEDVEARLDK